LIQERELHRANGEVYFAGGWMSVRDADRVARALQQREVLTFVETAFLLILASAVAWGLCWLFAFLFLPE
ncbi:MAG: hypothetical protein ACREUZ_20765, partial [Burkholderiales bacterium]